MTIRPVNGSMARRPVRLLALASGAVCVALLGSGCVVFSSASQKVSPGVLLLTKQVCASGSSGCASTGFSGLNAGTGIRQILLAIEVPAATAVSPTPTTDVPLTFFPSPDYAAELERLRPPGAGRKWVGWISAPFSYSTDPTTPQRIDSAIEVAFPPGPDGAPVASVDSFVDVAAGVRNVTPAGPAGRPVACGDSAETVHADVPDRGDGNGPAATVCRDAQSSVYFRPMDYGVVTSGARASGPAGTVASMPFVLRNSGARPETFGPVTLRATTTLPGATAVPVPGTLSPGENEDASALVAVGIPAGTAAGVYDVTLTATLKGGIVRTGVGKLTVSAPTAVTGSGGGGGTGTGGTTTTTRRLTTVLPKGLTVASARADGLPVLLGSTVAGPALVRLQQGPKKRPTVSIGKRVRLTAPGPVKVTFRSRKLSKGPYRVTISVAGKVVKTVSGRLVK